jgi:hypothetical protein
MASVPADKIDARQVLEKIRADQYAEHVSADLLAGVYAVEHDKQFEDIRGEVRAQLRDLIAASVKDNA